MAILFVTNDFLSRINRSLVMPRVNRLVKGYFSQKDASIVADKMGPAEHEHFLLAK